MSSLVPFVVAPFVVVPSVVLDSEETPEVDSFVRETLCGKG